MPKQKIKNSVKRRFKVTRNGKVLFRGQGARHLRRKKSKSQIRAFNTPKLLTGKFAKKIRRMLGLA